MFLRASRIALSINSAVSISLNPLIHQQDLAPSQIKLAITSVDDGVFIDFQTGR